jgi:hypothetical protein
MLYSNRSLFFRNSLVSITNGLITLTVLLIAPLGLAAVLTCTAAVTIASFFAGSISDKIFGWLEAGRSSQVLERR